MWQRFTERARRVVFFAQEEAGKRGTPDVEPEHLLLGLLRDDDTVAARVLTTMSINLLALVHEVRRLTPDESSSITSGMQLGARARRAIDHSYEEARLLNNVYIGTEHLLLGILRDEHGVAAQELRSHGAGLEEVRISVAALQAKSSLEGMRQTPDTAGTDSFEWPASVGRHSESTRRIISRARREASRLGENYFSTEHLLLGLLGENSLEIVAIFRRLGVTSDAIESELMRQISRSDGPGAEDPAPTPRAKRVMVLAHEAAHRLSDAVVEPEHLLLALIREGEGLAGKVLLKAGVDTQNALDALRAVRAGLPEPATDSGTRLEIQLEALRRRLDNLQTARVEVPTPLRAEPPIPAPLFGDLGVALPAAERMQVEVAHDAAAFRKLLAVFLAKDTYGYRSLTDGDQTVFLLPAGTRLKLLVPPTESEDLFEEAHHVRVLEGDYAGYAGWIVKAAFQRTGFDDSVFPPAD